MHMCKLVVFQNDHWDGASWRYLCSQTAQHHVSEQFGSKHGEPGTEHVRDDGQGEA